MLRNNKQRILAPGRSTGTLPRFCFCLLTQLSRQSFDMRPCGSKENENWVRVSVNRPEVRRIIFFVVCGTETRPFTSVNNEAIGRRRGRRKYWYRASSYLLVQPRTGTDVPTFRSTRVSLLEIVTVICFGCCSGWICCSHFTFYRLPADPVSEIGINSLGKTATKLLVGFAVMTSELRA
jgi:hypothetical protein